MEKTLLSTLAKYLRKIANDIEQGTCEVSDEQAFKIMSVISHRPLSKEQACSMMNMSRSKFDELVRSKIIPKGRKKRGFKELCWYEDELMALNLNPDKL